MSKYKTKQVGESWSVFETTSNATYEYKGFATRKCANAYIKSMTLK